MIDTKNSLLVPYQLPEFVRDNPDYDNFTLFVKSYYEWMELANSSNAASSTAGSQNQGAIHANKNLLNYSNIDATIDGFTDYYINEFLPYFPKDSLLSKQEAVKIARQLYQSKGTPASYEFLFRILYNSDFNIFYTKDAILKASDGQWYIAKSLKVSSTDEQFLNTANYRLFGESTKSIATIESAFLVGNKTEIFISNIERLFQSGEFVRVVDNNNQDVYFKDGLVVPSTTSGASLLRAKIVGQISSISVDKNNRGHYYDVGDPVVVYNGLSSNTGAGASAVVNTTNAGSIQRINVLTGGYGYSRYPGTIIEFNIETNGANAIVGSLDPNPATRSNVALIPIDTITFKKDIQIGNSDYQFDNFSSANANTTLYDAFSFTSFSTFPISSVLVINGGSGIRVEPTVTAIGGYESDLNLYSSNVANTPSLTSLGILAPIQITNGGSGYQNNETIIFTGGSGQGAFANVTVNTTGAIVGIEYVMDPLGRYPLGGMGYRETQLPAVTVDTANGSNAIIYVPGILGTGATMSAVTDNAGEIITIKIIDSGEDYITAPDVSLKVQDIVVSNVSVMNLPRKGDVIYQGANLDSSTYTATVNSVSVLTINADTTQSLWNLRVFNYNSQPDSTQNLIVVRGDEELSITMANTAYSANHFYTGSPEFNSSGVKTYGDGTAKATAKFLNGLVISEGQYLDTKGQPSSFSVIQSDIYNNYTYQITVEKEISKYRDMLLNLLHPSGMKVIGRYALKSNSNIDYTTQQAVYTGVPLTHYTGNTGTYVTMTTDLDNKSTNIVQFNDMPNDEPRTVLSDFLIPLTSKLTLTPTNGTNIHGLVISVDDDANTATLDCNTWLSFGNVAIATANAGSNTINIINLTSNNFVANSSVFEAVYPLQYIIFDGDTITLNNETKIVKTVDYVNGVLTLTTDMDYDANTYLSVDRKFVANSSLSYDQIRIFGPIGTPYDNPILTSEDGNTITTEDDVTLLVG